MSEARVRFYAELNDHLPREERYETVTVPFCPPLSMADLIVLRGVPTDEVDLVLRNGDPVRFTAPVEDGDRIAVYPVFESFDISGAGPVAGVPLRNPRFVCDVHLGKLASFLRMVGFDTLYRGDYQDDELIRISLDQRRALLSRDRRLLAQPGLVRKHAVASETPLDQLREVIHRFDLVDAARPFSRCLRCNTVLASVPRAQVLARLPERVRDAYDEFFHCGGCDRVYWRGSHFKRMAAVVSDLLERSKSERGRG